MEKSASVFLRADITRGDVEKLIYWMEDEAITRYLRDGSDTALRLRELSEDVPEYLLALNLNGDGRFYIIDGENDSNEPFPVGFVRLEEYAHRRYELVFAVGEEELWGRGLGTASVRETLYIAFFELRAEYVRALVYRENERSARVLSRCGFMPGYDGGRHMEYTLSFRQYLTHLERSRSNSTYAT